MKRVLLLLLICTTINAKSQTKKETEDWLVYYLNKYFSSDFDGIEANDNLHLNGAYIHHEYEFAFYKNKFIIRDFKFNRDTTGQENQTEVMTDSINLSKVIKLQVDSTGGENHYPKYSCRIVFHFKKPTTDMDFDEKPVTKYNNTNHKGIYYYYVGEYYFPTKNEDALQNNMPSRFQKAFEHLVSIDGGNLIKEAF